MKENKVNNAVEILNLDGCFSNGMTWFKEHIYTILVVFVAIMGVQVSIEKQIVL